jgi:hypothetical protein
MFNCLYLGDSALKGERVNLIRGTDLLNYRTITNNQFHQFNHTEYQSFLRCFSSLAMISVPVFHSIATINFQSRSTGALHFFAIYSTSNSCPQNYLFNTQIQKCQYVDVKKINIK